MTSGSIAARRGMWAWLLLSAAAVVCRTAQAGDATPASVPASAARPNIVFILADDAGWGDLGCYGHKRLKTPNLDRLAKQGILFTNFYSCGSVCSPSRVAFMTGTFPARHGVHGHFATADLNAKRGMPNYLDPAVPTLTRLLHDAGYTVGHFGKWHLGHGPNVPELTAYGCDDFHAVLCRTPGWNEPYDTFWPKSTTLFVDETIRFIRANKDKPFYVNVWTLLPHAPLNPTDEQMKPYEHWSPKGGIPHKSAETIYYASMGDLDTQVGRLMKELDALGLADKTVVVFSSDNGPEDIHLPEAGHSGVGSTGPFRGRKRSLYEGGIRMPFIVRWPGAIPAGKVDNSSVIAGADFLPTICSLARVPLKADMKLDGQDMSEAFRGKPVQRSRPLLWEWRFSIFGDILNRSPILAIRDGHWTLLMNPDRSRVELYDIPNDPGEVDNLAKDNPEVVERLAKVALEWQKTLPPGPFDNDAGSNAYPWPH